MNYGPTLGPSPAAVESVPDRFDFVELSIDEGEVPPDEIDRRTLRADLDTSDLDLILHLPTRQPLATGVPEFDDAHRCYLDRLLRFAASVDAGKAVLHATARDPSSNAQLDALTEQVRVVAEAGAARGVEIVVENVGQLTTGVSLDALGSLVDDLDVPLCFDVGHAHLETGQSGTESFLDAYAGSISHVHLHDVRRERDESHLPLGAGEIDFDPVGERLVDAAGRSERTLAVEILTADPGVTECVVDRFRSFE